MSLPPLPDVSDFDPVTGLGDPSTPLTAANLEGWFAMMDARVAAMIAAAIAALPGGGGASPLAVYRWNSSTGWPTLPTSAPSGVSLAILVGPSTASSPPAAPSWVGWDTGKVPLVIMAVPA